MMNGILVVDKPIDFTSFDVVAKLRGITGTRKIGHGGTLDPMATGVLPVFIGPAVKAVDLQLRQDKTYEADILFGVRTDTGDITGAVLEQSEFTLQQERAAGVLSRFLGEQSQLPPMYSAVKHKGKPLYAYARAGVQVERKPRRVTIHSIEALPPAADVPAAQAASRLRIRVHCSKGTYIRTLAEDIGRALGAPATLAALRRTRAGVFTLEQAATLAQIQHARDQGALPALLTPVETVFAPLPEAELSAGELQRLYNGAPVYGRNLPPGRYRVRSEGVFAGLAVSDADGLLHTEKMFVRG